MLTYWSQRPLKWCLPFGATVHAWAAVPVQGFAFRSNWVLLHPDDSEGHQILEHLYHQIIHFANAICRLYSTKTENIFGNEDAEWFLPFLSLFTWWINTSVTYSSQPQLEENRSYHLVSNAKLNSSVAAKQLHIEYPLKFSVLYLND